MTEVAYKRPRWQQAGLILSGTMYAILLMNTQSKLNFAINAVLALALMCLLILRFQLERFLFFGKSRYLYPVAAVLSVLAVYTGKSAFYTTCHGWIAKLLAFCGIPHADLLVRLSPWVAAAIALPMVFGYLLWFTDFFVQLARRLWKHSDTIEWIWFAGAAILFLVCILFVYQCTQAFYGAHVNGITYDYDLIYSADSGNLISIDTFRVVGAYQNDTRQPLYGLFSMPFAQIAWLLSRVFFFVDHSYVMILQMIQVLLFLAAVVLLARMLKLSGVEKALFLIMMSFSYPMLIFSLTVEQYLMAVFWLILLIFLQDEEPGGSLCFIASTGSLLTTGVLFPLITFDRNFKTFAKKTMQLCGAFFTTVILCGRLTVLLELPSSLSLYQTYSGADVSALSKLMQYINFAGSTLFAPASQVDNFTYAHHISYQMVPVTSWRLLGFAVLALALLGVFFGLKDRFSRICGCWILFSFVLLGLVGWGTVDNGLLLYSLYFGWAYVAMVFQAISHIFRRCRPLKLAVLTILILCMLLINIPTLQNAIVFGTQFYPALG